MSKRSSISSDYAKLNTVIVKSPGSESKRVNSLVPTLNRAGFSMDIVGSHAIEEHRIFKRLLVDSGIEVLELNDLIDNALEEARKIGAFDKFLERYYPEIYRLHGYEKNALSTEDLIGAGKKTFYPQIIGKSVFLTKPLQWMYYTRDVATILPNGIALNAFDNKSRAPETPLVRFMFQNTKRFKDNEIIFDAEIENVLLQGGDLIVLNEKTLIMGVDNMSERIAAQKLARKAGIDVIAVTLPKGPADNRANTMTAVNILFLHLDTLFNLIDEHKALVIPYFFQDEYAKENPFFAFLDSIELEDLSGEDRASIFHVREALKNIGTVSFYLSGSGKELKTNLKLVNFLEKEFGYNFAFIGGEPKPKLDEQVTHLNESVLPELRFQAGNIVTTEPGQVIMYENDTKKTQESLRKMGIKIITFDGHELVRWNGGPHCMTLPLARG